MDTKPFGLISSILYFIAGLICLLGETTGETRFLQYPIGVYFLGRGLQELREGFLTNDSELVPCGHFATPPQERTATQGETTYCPACGAKVEPEGLFCGGCGKKV